MAAIRRFAAAVLAAGLSAAPAFGQGQDFSKVEISTTRIAEGVYMLKGAGGNMALSTGVDGAFLVDDQYAPLSPKILAAIRKETDQPVVFLVNTHFHGDHAGGNEAFAARGTRVFAHENARRRMKEGVVRPGLFNSDPTAPASWPVVTFADGVKFYWNGEEIEVRHLAHAHTDGDAIVEFKNANVVHMGDLLFNGDYPFIDIGAGGGLDGYIAAQEAALAGMNDEVQIIPGHGPLATKAELKAANDMLKDARARVKALVGRGLSEDEAVRAEPLKDLDPEWASSFITGERMTRQLYQALKEQD